MLGLVDSFSNRQLALLSEQTVQDGIASILLTDLFLCSYQNEFFLWEQTVQDISVLILLADLFLYFYENEFLYKLINH